MALELKQKPAATIKIKDANSDSMFTVNGVTTANTSLANAQNQINKIFGIGGLSVAVDKNFKRIITEEVVDNG